MVYIIINPNSYHNYYLCSIIAYVGYNNNGNFIGYCRDGPNSNFVCYNDTSVYMVSVEDAIGIKNSNNKKQNNKVLFYHYIE